VESVSMQGHTLIGRLECNKDFRTYAPPGHDVAEHILDKGIPFTVRPEIQDPWYIEMMVQWFPMLLLVGVWIFFMRQMQVGGGKAMSFGKSKARLLSEHANKVTFSHVAVIENARDESEEIIVFLRERKTYTRL